MKVVVFAGFSGAGKTTLLEGVIALLKAQGQRVSVLKHAHHRFDIDQPGKDSWRHRQAGAHEVLIASDQRLALIHEYESRHEPDVHDLLARLSPVDWVLVEGFKHSALPKLEVWRASVGKSARYVSDPCIVAIATDSPGQLPEPTLLPVMDLDDAEALADFLVNNQARFHYAAGPLPGAGAD